MRVDPGPWAARATRVPMMVLLFLEVRVCLDVEVSPWTLLPTGWEGDPAGSHARTAKGNCPSIARLPRGGGGGIASGRTWNFGGAGVTFCPTRDPRMIKNYYDP